MNNNDFVSSRSRVPFLLPFPFSLNSNYPLLLGDFLYTWHDEQRGHLWMYQRHYTWPHLRKASFHIHNSKTHFSPSNDSCTHELTNKAGIDAESYQAAFAVACDWDLSDVHKCLTHLQMASYPLDKKTDDCNSPHNWMMSLAMDLAALCDMWNENGTNG